MSELERTQRKFDAVYGGYRAYYDVCAAYESGAIRSVGEEDSNSLELWSQNRVLYAQYLERLERIGKRLFESTTEEKAATMRRQGSNLTGSTPALHMSGKQPSAKGKTSAASSATMNGIDSELDGMVGRLRIEVQTILGFARLAAGDLFEVVVKHGSQKWKTRGKTQPDRSQRWESTAHMFTCYPDHLVTVKISEVRLIKSKLLSERHFDPVKFFAPQPLLVTMNLNSTGSLKLKMIVTWLPLTTSKSLPPEIIPAQPLQKSATLQHLDYRNNNLPAEGDEHDSSLPIQQSCMALSNGANSTLTSDSTPNGTKAAAEAEVSPPRVCLREKKRARQSTTTIGGATAATRAEAQKWRSSTNILDSVYKDLSRSIPTVDDLTAFGGNPMSNSSLHRPQRSESSAPSGTASSTASTGQTGGTGRRAAAKPRLGTAILGREFDNSAAWSRSLSMHQLESTASGDPHRPAANPQRPPQPTAGGHPARNSLYCSTATNRSDSDDSSGVSSLGAARTVASNGTKMSASTTSSSASSAQASPQCYQQADLMLRLVDQMRTALAPVRSAEWPELAGFEAVMLQWEALLKLNRAVLVEHSRTTGMRRPNGLSSGSNRLVKRSSIYVQHSPSSGHSDEMDGHTNGDHVFENDSGIDSLRQHVSPYNRGSGLPPPADPAGVLPRFHHQQMGSEANGRAAGPAQRRFRQIRERRRSLGFALDDPAEFERHFGAEAAAMAGLSPPTKPPAQRPPQADTATGNSALDLCLQHHLNKSLADLEELKTIRGPMEFRLAELLVRFEQNTVALEEMLRIAERLPALPNVGNLLMDLGADREQQEIWLSTCYPMNWSIIVPVERLRVNLRTIAAPIVRVCYPNLISRVVESLLQLIQCRSDGSEATKTDEHVSIFEFVACFQAKHTASFIENLAHEAFITASLESRNPQSIRGVMDRLRQVPIVPPIESLRNIGLVLSSDVTPECQAAIERYLKSAANGLQNDLCASFVNLLEHRDSNTRVGACRALSVLCNEHAVESLEFLSNEDENPQVRREAHAAVQRIQRFFADYHQEVTKI
ncbi:PL48 domain-containing protein [Aphelenchoides fujianensis]|nr:PL48 domain-containing protein [Aphelenchoides fujianensis]